MQFLRVSIEIKKTLCLDLQGILLSLIFKTHDYICLLYNAYYKNLAILNY